MQNIIQILFNCVIKNLVIYRVYVTQNDNCENGGPDSCLCQAIRIWSLNNGMTKISIIHNVQASL
jgi:hypothetical protein